MKNKRRTKSELVKNLSFRRWANGTADRAETKKWDRWISKSEENRETAQQALQEITGLEIATPDLPDVQQEWENVRNQLDAPGTDANDEKNRKKYQKPSSRNWMYSIAAIMLLGFLVGWLAIPNYSPEKKEQSEQVAVDTITSDYGEKKTLNLSDGSSITLAAGSKLTYRQNWLSKPVKRLELEGEAYFSIAPSEVEDHPKFVVETEDGDAAVWGTKFTVSTYGEGTQVVLEEGEVRVTVEGLSEGDKENQITMVPGQLLSFRKADRDIAIREVNALVYTAWASNKLVFDDTPVSHLVDRIKRTYDVDVEVESKELMQKKLSGSVNFEDLDSLIQAISEVLEIEITRTDRTVFINGTKPNRVNQ